MPVYAFAPQQRNEPTPGESAVNLGNTLAGLYSNYQQNKAQESAKNVLNDPKASSMQKALAWAQLGQGQVAAQTVKQEGQQDMLKNLSADLANVYGTGAGGAINVPGATPPIRPNSAQDSASNAIKPSTAQIPSIGMNAPPGSQEQSPEQTVPQATQRVPQPESPESLLGKAQQLRGLSQKYASNPTVSNRLADDAKALETKVANDQKLAQKTIEFERKKFVEERDNAQKVNKPYDDRMEGIKNSLPTKRQALALARDAVSSGEIGPLSLNNLAKRFHIPELKTSSGAKLDLAIKENLISNLSRVTGRAQNKWLEQVAIGAFAQVGETQAANETKQEALEAELALSEAEEKIYDRIKQEDIEKFGYEQPNIRGRVDKELRPIEDEIMKRASYRTREIYETEQGIDKLKEMTQKPVPSGTILTPLMARVFVDNINREQRRHGDNLDPQQVKKKAAARAKSLGYTIISPEKASEYGQ